MLLIACAVCMQSQSQQTKTPVELADQYFAAGEYYTAAHLYEQFLKPVKRQKSVSDFPLNTRNKRKASTLKGRSRLDILFKQAESYRLANYWQKAAIAYNECAEKNTTEYPEAKYWYAVCMRSLDQYAAAEESIKQYLSSAGTNSFKEAAEKELETLSYIQRQLTRPDSILFSMQKLNTRNGSEKGLFAPVHIGGNHFMISSTQTDSVQKSGINPHQSKLFYATLNNGSLEEMTPVTLPSTDRFNHQGAASISADGNYLYFSQWRKEKGRTVSSIYFATKKDGNWSLPALLPSLNTNEQNSKQPFCSGDGKYLFFASDRQDGFGGFDIWYAPLNEDGTTGEPTNAGAVVNTSSDEQAPFYHNSSNTLVFSSNGRIGMGGYDLYSAKGNDSVWNRPENLGHPVNSSRDDIYFFAQEKATLLSNAIFSSDRGAGCCLETYSISKAPKNKRLTGTVRDCADDMPVAEAEVMLKDAAEKSWTVVTDAEGKYVIDLMNNAYRDLTLSIRRELYNDTLSSYKVQRTDESDLLTDVLINTDICIEKKPVIKPVDSVIVIKAEDVVTVYFDFDRSTLSPAAISSLDSIYNVLVEFSAATIQISGYTDGLGSVAYNNMLSDKRARACGDYLIEKGIDTNRIRFVSFGACCPVEMELINGRDNTDGRSRNRRALINIKKDDE